MTEKKENLLVDDAGQVIDLNNYASFEALVDLKNYRKTSTLLLEVMDNDLAPQAQTGDVLLLDTIGQFKGEGIYALDLKITDKVREEQVLAYVQRQGYEFLVHKPGVEAPARKLIPQQIKFLGKAIGVIKGK